MFIHPQFDPVAIYLGPLEIRWYGLMYLFGFGTALLLGRYRIKRQPWLQITAKDLDDMLFMIILGIIIGGRIGYILFYKPEYYLANPAEIIAVWKGGMSFHGGFLGVLAAMFWFTYTRKRSWLKIMDFIAPLVPPGLAAGRMGNFINGELWGRPTELPWSMIFPQADNLARHPSQLYQFAMEGILLFLILWFFSSKQRPAGAISGIFLIGYGIFRFIAEFAREPDNFLGVLALGLTMGQWLSLPMILIGLGLLGWSYRKKTDQSI